MDPSIGITVTASSILFGFLFSGFWWALNRELEFEEGQRHFQPVYLLLFLTMAVLAWFGILRPLRAATNGTRLPPNTLLGLATAFIGIFGYMLTAFAHYSIFQKPKYKTALENSVFSVFVLILMALLVVIAFR